ncbi:hypothetical protein [Herbaspirillum sp. B65]|uniref:hypothetical protein n=1 Tax=Herbaspirillum sp. B65 TaxID=137708 RepID=UPI00034AFCD7|nr:hypothetical protein [Herbaspirillum sp. B65]
MFIKEIISYGGAWEDMQHDFPEQLASIYKIVAEMSRERMSATIPRFGGTSRSGDFVHWAQVDQAFSEEIEREGWGSVDLGGSYARRRDFPSLMGIGRLYDNVSLAYMRHRDGINRWLYTVTPLAFKYGVIKMPVALVIDDRSFESIVGRPSFQSTLLYNRLKTELQELAPLSSPTPFLIFCLSLRDEGLNVIDIPSDVDVESETGAVVINRAIEFPPEYRQAGIGILSYFGTVLEEKYPGSDAKVRIEQDGLCVRLIVESENGNREVIERALQEYEMVVRGEASPDMLFQSRAKVIELQAELRIAQVRVDTQRDVITLQGQEIHSLRQLIGHSLTQHRPISLTVSPTINVTNALQIQKDVQPIGQYISELVHLSASDPDVQLRLLDLGDAISGLTATEGTEQAKASSGLKKLKHWLDDAMQTGSSTNAFLQKVSDGFDLLQKIAKRYNSIAEWCGAPQVPSVLLKND